LPNGDPELNIEIHGYALVSADDRIADADGQMPAGLHNDADWAYFQRGLDLADITAIGRVSHEATPNTKGRRRLVLSRGACGLERRDDAWWWNPAETPWSEVTARLLPEGGRVAVPGGQAAFDVLLRIGFTGFHLSRAARVTLPGGRGVFAVCEAGASAEDTLRGAGLKAQPAILLDAAAEVSLTLWRARA